MPHSCYWHPPLTLISEMVVKVVGGQRQWRLYPLLPDLVFVTCERGPWMFIFFRYKTNTIYPTNIDDWSKTSVWWPILCARSLSSALFATYFPTTWTVCCCLNLVAILIWWHMEGIWHQSLQFQIFISTVSELWTVRADSHYTLRFCMKEHIVNKFSILKVNRWLLFYTRK